LYVDTYIFIDFSAASGWKIRRERALANGMRPVWPVNPVQEILVLRPAPAPDNSEPNDDKPDACDGPLQAAKPLLCRYGADYVSISGRSVR
jgi:hypothetical protein